MKSEHMQQPKMPFDRFAQEYDAWFTDHGDIYRSELDCLKALMPEAKGLAGIDIGMGTGVFALELGARVGVEPSRAMLEIALKKGLNPISGRAEALPFADGSYDFALMVTTDCFLSDLEKALKEVNRVLKPGGFLLTGMIPRNSFYGRKYTREKKQGNPLYQLARFHTVEGLLKRLTKAGFTDFSFRQTLLGKKGAGLSVVEGYGEGSFVAVGACKK
jgi:ubiquinone/menaquinone biosynthesis C-methylase UbiE